MSEIRKSPFVNAQRNYDFFIRFHVFSRFHVFFRMATTSTFPPAWGDEATLMQRLSAIGARCKNFRLVPQHTLENGFRVSSAPATKGHLIAYVDGSRQSKYGPINRDTGGIGVWFEKNHPL